MTAASFEEKVDPTDLSDEHQEIIGPQLPLSPPVGADRTVDMRKVVNGIFYLNRMGCQWRMLPNEYEQWNKLRLLRSLAQGWDVGSHSRNPAGFGSFEERSLLNSQRRGD